MYVEYIGNAHQITRFVYSSRSRSVTVVYDDVFTLYTRILGAIAIPLLILGLIIEKILRNSVARIYVRKMLGKELRNGPYEWLLLGSMNHLLTDEEKSWMRAQQDIFTI